MVATILVVDDEASLRELYKSELSAEGYNVMVAATGKEAVDILNNTRPDVIVMDIGMPEMNGIEALGKVIARHKNIPVIINTAYASYKDDFRAWAADEYVVKSSDLSSLKDALRKVLKRQHGG